ncbi:hypothetical protein UCRPC4_g04431 [Phaeomoniella chlamydospora]|uniref:Kinetochore protein Sos7 coiled-coil domain-containing protein n=1 Tax=Phaeomoniella chlamydospora TaxID=158046 RepID=A0A0G2GSG4_PHACM|nr:hypothetical protein UCRPC4_g04431 [Phaeomoniella chlamydospora]
MAATSVDTAALLARAQDLLSQLQNQHESNPLSILRLSEPISAAATTKSSQLAAKRSSNASEDNSDSSENVTPASLAADLSHYRDLFTKLHFSYIEQVTKEKYLRAIVGDPPVLHTHQENVELETETAEMKKQLKEKKVEVEKMVDQMKEESESLAKMWEEVQRDVERLEVLEREVRQGEQRVESLRTEVEEKEATVMDLDGPQNEPDQKLGLEDTLALIAQREQEMKDMERQIQELRKEEPARVREVELAEKDVEALKHRRDIATAEANEARRRKEHGGRDEVEERGRWYKSQQQVYRGLGLVEG